MSPKNPRGRNGPQTSLGSDSSVLHLISLFYCLTFSSLSLCDFQLLIAFPGMTYLPTLGLSQQVYEHSSCFQGPMSSISFLGSRETVIDLSAWK